MHTLQVLGSALVLAFVLACERSSPDSSTSTQSEAIVLKHGQRLPALPNADPLPDSAPRLLIDMVGVYLGDREIVSFSNRDGRTGPEVVEGHVILPLYTALGEVREQDTRLLVIGDDRIPYSTVVDIVRTATRAGFESCDLVVSQASGSHGVVTVGAAQDNSVSESGERTLDLRVTIVEDGYFVSTASQVGTPRESSMLPLVKPFAPLGEVDRWDTAALEAEAAKIKRFAAMEHMVNITSESEIPLGALVGAIGALRGSECGPTRETCLFPDVRVGPLDADDEPWDGLVGSNSEDIGLVGRDSTGLIGLGNTGPLVSDQPEVRVRPGTVQVQHAKAEVQGALDRDTIRHIVRAHINEIQSCYNAGLTSNPNLRGRVAINFVITGTGKVGSAVVQESTIKDASVGNCIAKAVKRWTFPKPRGGGNVIVTYPFNLTPN